jgi:site-specific recombinase XerD
LLLARIYAWLIGDVVIYRTPEGKQKWESGFETKGQAQTGITEVLGQIQTGGYVGSSEKTLGDFADEWLKNRVNVRGSTSEGYECYLKVHVKPDLGKMKLTDIRHSHVQGFVAGLTGKKTRKDTPLSANTIRKIITMLKSIFKSAVKNDLIYRNPAAALEIPSAIKAKIEPPSMKDVLAILQKALVEYQPI